jgi:hypothetical protein
LAQRWPDYSVVDELYYVLEAEGHTFSDPPTRDDFELLFTRALSLLRQPLPDDVLFDRSPADYLAYLTALRADITPEQVSDAAATLADLDLIVFVPIESPDRVTGVEAPRLRRRVDEIMREMLIDRAWPFDVPTLEVHGTVGERGDQVIDRVATNRAKQLR